MERCERMAIRRYRVAWFKAQNLLQKTLSKMSGVERRSKGSMQREARLRKRAIIETFSRAQLGINELKPTVGAPNIS